MHRGSCVEKARGGRFDEIGVVSCLVRGGSRVLEVFAQASSPMRFQSPSPRGNRVAAASFARRPVLERWAAVVLEAHTTLLRRNFRLRIAMSRAAQEVHLVRDCPPG